MIWEEAWVAEAGVALAGSQVAEVVAEAEAKYSIVCCGKQLFLKVLELILLLILKGMCMFISAFFFSIGGLVSRAVLCFSYSFAFQFRRDEFGAVSYGLFYCFFWTLGVVIPSYVILSSLLVIISCMFI